MLFCTEDMLNFSMSFTKNRCFFVRGPRDEYADGTNATVEQMSKDVTTFLMWAAEPHLESRHQMGFKAIIYLIILTILVYFSMKKIWSRVESEV